MAASLVQFLLADITHYEVLEVPESASPEQIHDAYARLVQGGDPDGDAEGRMQRLNDAWAVLQDAGQREQYDLLLNSNRHPSPPPVPMQYCSECGQPWPPEELARFGDRLICANCKISYAQKLREGVASAATFTYAGFWIRFAAALLDGIILFVAGIVVQLPFARMLSSRRIEDTLIALGAVYLLDMAIGATYEGVFISRFGATPGKMALDLKVVRPDGGPVSLGRAVGRYFAKMVSAIILMIGYIMAGFDSQKRALHDLICDTRVIRIPSRDRQGAE
ncbi:MAG: RDD family protein [Bryobacteraceae bacterium]